MVLYRNTQQDLPDILTKIYFTKFQYCFMLMMQSNNTITQSFCAEYDDDKKKTFLIKNVFIIFADKNLKPILL